MKAAKSAMLVCLALLGIQPAQAASPHRGKSERLIARLATVDFGRVYNEDGAAEGSVTEGVRPGREQVDTVLDLKDSAIPLLIAHLDDNRPTRTIFKGRPVPLGFVALDLLTHIVGPNPEVFDPENADDGLGSGIRLGYYFRPDASVDEMARAKRNWQILRRRKLLAFHDPRRVSRLVIPASPVPSRSPAWPV
jgi:hypothetical protein